MINVARGISEEAVEKGEPETSSGKSIVFVEGTAEELEGPWREDGRKVDLLIASTAVCVMCLFVVAAMLCVANGWLVPRPTGSTCRGFMLRRPKC